jgi:hypothetical protein
MLPSAYMQEGRPQWQVVLDLAVPLKLHALLDCGALLAGATNRWVASCSSCYGSVNVHD